MTFTNKFALAYYAAWSLLSGPSLYHIHQIIAFHKSSISRRVKAVYYFIKLSLRLFCHTSLIIENILLTPSLFDLNIATNEFAFVIRCTFFSELNGLFLETWWTLTNCELHLDTMVLPYSIEPVVKCLQLSDLIPLVPIAANLFLACEIHSRLVLSLLME